MPSSLLVFLLFAVLLSLHLHTFLMFFTLVLAIVLVANGIVLAYSESVKKIGISGD